MKIIPKCIKTKRHLCASGSILLPLAQKWGLVGVVAIVALSAFGVQSASAASITLTTPQSLVINVTPSAEGKFAKSNAESISVASDAYAGYTLKITGNDNNVLVDGDKKLLSLDGADGISETTFNSATYNDRWGYRPSKFKSKSNDNFLPGPKLSGDIIDETKNANIETNNYTVELGARISNAQAAGNYKGTFIISAVANDSRYSIAYDGNGADSDVPKEQSSSAAEGTEITIAEAPTRESYYFVGWCTQKSVDETCDGEVYQPEETYKLVNGDNTLNLYAMWTKKTMQNWTGCDSLGNKTAYLPDMRDNNIYRVRKLADDKCWMVDNLRLGDSTMKNNRKLTSADSDIVNEYTLPESNEASFKNDDNGAESIYVVEEENGLELKIYGGYYSWCAATADTCTQATKNGDNAPNSICPKGWHLPTGNTDGEFSILDKALPGGTGDKGSRNGSYLLADNNDANSPAFVHGGRYNSSDSPLYQNVTGYYWSSTARNDTSAYDMLFSNSEVHPGTDSYYRSSGRSVRCVARE